MLALVVTLSVFVVILVLVVGLIVLRLLRDNSDLEKDNNNLEKDNKDLQKKLDELMNAPSMVGVSYKTNSKDVSAIMSSVRSVFVQLQKAGCVTQTDADASRKAFVDSVSEAQLAKPTKCSEIGIIYSTQIDKLVDGMSQNVPKENASSIRSSLKSLVQTILASVCTDDKIDTKKLDALLKDVFDAICTNIK